MSDRDNLFNMQYSAAEGSPKDFKTALSQELESRINNMREKERVSLSNEIFKSQDEKEAGE
tara:strand:+ start:480 stop:662 length:183 start_codon:yes stop_codon:yes gene_type:complete